MAEVENGTIFVYMRGKPTLMHVCALSSEGVGGIDMEPVAISDMERKALLNDDRKAGMVVQSGTMFDVTITTSFPASWDRDLWLLVFAQTAEHILKAKGVL